MVACWELDRRKLVCIDGLQQRDGRFPSNSGEAEISSTGWNQDWVQPDDEIANVLPLSLYDRRRIGWCKWAACHWQVVLRADGGWWYCFARTRWSPVDRWPHVPPYPGSRWRWLSCSRAVRLGQSPLCRRRGCCWDGVPETIGAQRWCWCVVLLSLTLSLRCC